MIGRFKALHPGLRRGDELTYASLAAALNAPPPGCFNRADAQNRSRFITLLQAAAKSFTNFACASSEA